MNALPISPKEINVEPFYYVTNFRLMVAYAFGRYRDFFTDEEQQLIDGFLELPQRTQALFVRLFNRKGLVFCLDKLDYSEIGDLTPHVDRLAGGSWLTTDVEDVSCDELLARLTVSELRRQILDVEIPLTMRRAEILETLRQSEPHVCRRLKRQYRWVHVTAKELFMRVMTLFFCNRHQDMSEFVKVDLGHVRVESYAIDGDNPFFSDRRHLEQYLFWGEVLDDVHEWAVTQQFDAVIRAGLEASRAWAPDKAWSSSLARIRKHAARALERKGELEQAVETYADLLAWRHDDEWASRRILCLERLKRPKEALNAARRAMTQSSDPAYDRFFHTHLRKNQKALNMELDPMPESFRPIEREILLERTGHYLGSKAAYAHGRGDAVSVEEAVLVDLSRQGWSGVFAENSYIKTICGLLAWEVVYAPVPGAFQHPFQGGPMDLNEPNFFERRRTLVDDLCRTIRHLSGSELLQRFRRQYRAKWDIFCYLNHAQRFHVDQLTVFVDHCGPDGMATLIQRFFRQYRFLRRGFPDLAVWRDGELRCLEVKGPGDQLRQNQIIWLDLLTQLGIDAHVVKVRTPPDK